MDYVVGCIKCELLLCFLNVDDVVVLNYVYGCGVVINVLVVIVLICMLQNLVLNFNFGGEIMVIGLGCEKFVFECFVLERFVLGGCIFIEVVGMVDLFVLCLQDEVFDGFIGMIDVIMEMVECCLEYLNKCQCEICLVFDFVVGVQCGGSDVFLGVMVNFVVGFVVDLIVCVGGIVMFLEVIEVCDVIYLFMLCVIDEDVGCVLLCEMVWYDNYLSGGQIDCSVNLLLGNKKGGLLNVVEKVFGLIVKLGSMFIVDVFGLGEKVCCKGLIFVVIFVSDFVCGMLQLVFGMNFQVFIIGCGMLYGLVMVLVIKVLMCKVLFECWYDLIDFDVGCIVMGEVIIVDIGWELFYLIFDVVSGCKEVCVDKLGLYNVLVLFNFVLVI